MRLFSTCVIILFLGYAVNAQIDSRNQGVFIPAIPASEEPKDKNPIPPSKAEVFDNVILSPPKAHIDLEPYEQPFSMFADEEFGNPGELYTKQVNKNIANLKLTPEEIEQRNGSTTDQFFGDFKSQAKFVNVVYRDHGYTDGDLIQVRVNSDVIQARVFLTGSYSGFKLDLKPGLNKIDFVALNQGESGPNTAEFKVVDDDGVLVSHNQWNLATGVKATIIIVKE